MAHEDRTARSSWFVAAPGVIACIGVVWLGFQLAQLNDHVAALAAPTAPPPVPPAAGSSAAPRPAAPPAQPVAVVPLDAEAFARAWEEAAARRAETDCWQQIAPAADAPDAFAVEVRVHPSGRVEQVTMDAADRERAPELASCVLEWVHVVRLPADPAVRAGKVRVGRPAAQTPPP